MPWCAPFALSALTPGVHVATIAPGCTAFVEIATMGRLVGAFHRAGYRHIVIDMPSDARKNGVILDLAGGVPFIARARKTKAAALRRAVERVGERKALGVTMVDA